MTTSPGDVKPDYPRPSGRTKLEWRSLTALGFVLVAIVALVAVPWSVARRSRPLAAELTEVVAPARGLVTRVNVALALQGSLLRDYIESRDTALTLRYREAYDEELSAARQLRGLLEQLGPATQPAYVDFLRKQQVWHDRIDVLLSRPAALTERDPLRSRDYEELLRAVVRIDASLETAGAARRADMQRLDRLQTRLSAGLGLLAIAAALIVGWLARKLRRYATRLEERQEALNRATESRELLMRGITHDLKNPLQAIDGHAQLLDDPLRSKLTAEQHDSIMRIRKAVRTMLALIDDLMDLARAETGHLRMTREPVDVTRIVQDLVAQHRPAAELAGHVLELAKLPASLPAVTDPRRVQQVLGNLMTNAIKYTPPGGRITVLAETRARDEKQRRRGGIAIDVCDTGDGVPAEQQEAIFADFARLDRHEAIPGAGIGLSISRRLAKLLDGDLTLRSEPGGGATFTLWIPRDANA